MPESLRQEALDCVEHLEDHKATLTGAVNFYVRHRRATEKSCRVFDRIGKFLPAKKLAGRSERFSGRMLHYEGER